MKIKNIVPALAVLLAFGLVGCEKYEIAEPATQMHFANSSAATYFVLQANSSFDVPIGVTTVADVDRTITVNISSPTGAQAGREYTVTNNPVVIKAGEALGTVKINGNLSRYTSGRKDSLIMTLSSPDLAQSDYNSTFRLFMRGPCFEDETKINEMVGTYANTNENFGGPYGPYTTTISATTSTGPTSGTVTVTNIFDFGWNPIVFKLDWSDPANTKVTLDRQTGIADASTVFGAAQAGRTIMVETYPGRTGTFSYCNKTLRLEIRVGITELGAFTTTPYTVTMAR